MLHTKINLEVGKSYHLRSSYTQGKPRKLHIDNIFPYPGEDDIFVTNMIMYRYWSKRWKMWEWKVEPWYTLAVYNDWKYKE